MSEKNNDETHASPCAPDMDCFEHTKDAPAPNAEMDRPDGLVVSERRRASPILKHSDGNAGAPPDDQYTTMFEIMKNEIREHLSGDVLDIFDELVDELEDGFKENIDLKREIARLTEQLKRVRTCTSCKHASKNKHSHAPECYLHYLHFSYHGACAYWEEDE